MIVLGIDPGSRRIGYGLVVKTKNKTEFIDAGILKIGNGDNSEALRETRKQIGELINKHKPEVLAIERIYFSRNQTTGIQVAEFRGVIIVTASDCGLIIKEYSPNEVKSKIAGYGLADKKSVAKMVKLILGKPGLNIIDDATDALALAILGASERVF